LGQKSEEVRKYHADQAMVFTRIRELIGHPGEIANKARLYDQLVEAGDPTSTKQTIPILVTYARRVNDLFAEIQKIVPPGIIPGVTWIAIRNPLRSGGRSGLRAGSARNCRAQPAGRWLRTEEFQKRSGQDSLLRSQTEEYRLDKGRICEVWTWAVTGSQNFRPV
jgi:hypothetical protein